MAVRTITPTEVARLDAARYNVHAAVEIQDADGVWRDYTTHGGADWFLEARIRGEIDAPMIAGTVLLRREAIVAGVVKSLAPQIVASTINRDALGNYAPAIDVGRGIRLKTATTDADVAPIAGDWKYIVEGKIDAVDTKTASPVLTVDFRDKGAVLAETNIEVVRTYGTGGVALETIIQTMLDDNLGAGVVTLYTPVATGAVFNEFPQEQTTLLEALRALALQVGHDVRYLYDAADVFRLTLYLPDRAKTVADWTFGPGNYFEVPEARISDADVRNAIRVWYTDGATHTRLSVTATVPASITKYGRRFMEIEEAASSNIDSATEANAMATAAAADLGSPYFEHAIEARYYWPLQVNDLCAFLSNAVHYDATQKMAIVAYEHTLRRDAHRTMLRGRGSPLGAYRDWLFRGRVPTGPGGVTIGPPLALAANIFWRNDGTYFYTAYGNENVASWKVVARTDREPTDAEVRAGATVNGRNISVDSSPTTYPAGTTIYIGAIPYQGAGATGLEATPAIQSARQSTVVDMGTPSVIGKTAANVARSAGDATALDVIVDKLRNDGDLAETMQQYDGVTARVIAKGHQAGTGRNGDAIVFPAAFQNVPMILLRGGIKYEPRSGQWSPSYTSGNPQYEDLVALSPSASGFTLRARLRQKGALTQQDHNFAANSVTTVGGDSGSATTTAAPSSTDAYTVRFDVTVTTADDPGVPVTAALTVAIDTWDGSSWTERYTSTFTRSVTSPGSSTFGGTQAVNVTVAGMTSSSAFRVRAKAFSDSSAGGDSSFVLHGRTASDGSRGVTYFTATDAYADATPATDDVIYWEAIETA